jgi:hypothetical protein
LSLPTAKTKPILVMIHFLHVKKPRLKNIDVGLYYQPPHILVLDHTSRSFPRVCVRSLISGLIACSLSNAKTLAKAMPLMGKNQIYNDRTYSVIPVAVGMVYSTGFGYISI